ncbi:MAG: DUF721 domain-containing protein [Planctomycetota bacterium]
MNDRPRVRKIGSIVGQLMSQRGYAQVSATEELHQAIISAVGRDLGSSVMVGNLRGGKLQLFAADSVTLQELNFQKRTLLKRIQADMPSAGVTELRFRIQSR